MVSARRLATMSKGAGARRERVSFWNKPEPVPDGFGGFTSGWSERFQRRVEFVHLRGGESVQAARLTGQHTIVVRVRSSSEIHGVTTDWKIRDERRGVDYQIKDIEVETSRDYVSFTCQSGVAA